MFSSKMFVLIMVALTAVIIGPEAQTPPSCASKLVLCQPYLSSPKPPAECCDPLREAITNELDCLCKLYENPMLLPSLGINVTQALELPKACNIPGDISSCNKGGKDDKNGANRFTWSGMPILVALCASLMLT